MANSERGSDASNSGEGFGGGSGPGRTRSATRLRYEYDRENKSPALPPVTGQLSCVEEETRPDYFR
jgi:hypothetical protein